MSEIICEVCPHHCHLNDGQTGFCKARMNENGKNICRNYGKLTSVAVDPVEKKPLYGFYPGSKILSVGSFGCNLACPFCQNYSISARDDIETMYISPEQLLSIALRHPESIGIAFTYNEPCISYEYVLDCARLLKKHSLKTVLVTNGCVSMEILEKLIPYTDAMNIDLKGDRAFYQELAGDYDTVKKCIAYCVPRTHTEVTSLIIPGKNDSDKLMEEHASWLASLDPDLILHLSRYFPRYRYHIPPTDPQILFRLKEIAEKHLRHVYLGNI